MLISFIAHTTKLTYIFYIVLYIYIYENQHLAIIAPAKG